MILLKSLDKGATWTPLEYYARNCEPYFQKGISRIITSTNPTAVICNSSLSQELPYEGGEVRFGVLELR